ncbi:hypothetical protein U9M48_003942, partial [Paspalum notatum var. saurae]
HIDPANEELPPDQPLIEEPEDDSEDPHATADHTTEEAPLTQAEKDDISGLDVDPLLQNSAALSEL